MGIDRRKNAIDSIQYLSRLYLMLVYLIIYKVSIILLDFAINLSFFME